jgi:hypothetical protein
MGGMAPQMRMSAVMCGIRDMSSRDMPACHSSMNVVDCSVSAKSAASTAQPCASSAISALGSLASLDTLLDVDAPWLYARAATGSARSRRARCAPPRAAACRRSPSRGADWHRASASTRSVSSRPVFGRHEQRRLADLCRARRRRHVERDALLEQPAQHFDVTRARRRNRRDWCRRLQSDTDIAPRSTSRLTASRRPLAASDVNGDHPASSTRCQVLRRQRAARRAPRHTRSILSLHAQSPAVTPLWSACATLQNGNTKRTMSALPDIAARCNRRVTSGQQHLCVGARLDEPPRHRHVALGARQASAACMNPTASPARQWRHVRAAARQSPSGPPFTAACSAPCLLVR